MSVNTIAAETEENIETAIVTTLTTACAIPVNGVLMPASSGTVKRLTADTFISVAVDQSSQDLDFVGSKVPHTYTLNVTVHYAQVDDINGSAFRDECRKVRAALRAFTGDGCANLGAASFVCDEFLIDTTTTSFEGGENPIFSKAYSATLKGRSLN